jgi:hypothetical protein
MKAVVPTVLTLLNAAVQSVPSLWLVTARPMNTSVAIVMLADPTCVQLDPSGETKPVKVLPERVTRTHLGALPVDPDVLAELPPVEVRRWKALALPAEINMCACFDPAVKVSRIMTPAFAQVSVFSIEATRALISPSPDSFLRT